MLILALSKGLRTSLSKCVQSWMVTTKIPMCTVSKSLNQPTVGSILQSGAKNDIILYKYDNPRYFRYLNLFAMSQIAVWMSIGYFATTLRDVPVPEKKENEDENVPVWQKVNLGDKKYKGAIIITSALVGYGIFAACWFLTLRSVRYLILRKDAKNVSIVTYTPFGQNRIHNVPLDSVSCVGSRTAGSSYIPLQVQNRKFYFILDTKGEFLQPQLFDRTVGIQRKFKSQNTK